MRRAVLQAREWIREMAAGEVRMLRSPGILVAKPVPGKTLHRRHIRRDRRFNHHLFFKLIFSGSAGTGLA